MVSANTSLDSEDIYFDYNVTPAFECVLDEELAAPPVKESQEVQEPEQTTILMDSMEEIEVLPPMNEDDWSYLPPPPRRRRRLLLALVCLAAMAVIVAFFVSFIPNQGRTRSENVAGVNDGDNGSATTNSPTEAPIGSTSAPSVFDGSNDTSPATATTIAPTKTPVATPATSVPTQQITATPTKSPISIQTNPPTARVTVAPTVQASPAPTQDTCSTFVQAENNCYNVQATINIAFENCDPREDDWLGIYPSNTPDLSNLGDPDLWLWACGSKNCRGKVLLDTLPFGGGLEVGNYVAHLIRRNSGGPYSSYAASPVFSVSRQC